MKLRTWPFCRTMLTHFQYQHMLVVHLGTVEPPMLRLFRSSMALSILLKCCILHRFSSSNFLLSHSSRANRAIKMQVCLVDHPLLRSSMLKTNNKSLIIMLLGPMGVEACKAFLSPKTHHHCHCSCNSNSRSRGRIITLLIQLARLSLRWVVKTVHLLLIVASLALP